MTDVQHEYEQLIRKFQNPEFSENDHAAIADQLDADLGLAAIAARLWMGMTIDHAVSSQPGMFMAKLPGENLTVKQGEHIQWTWGQHHFMLYLTPLNEPATAMLGLFVDDVAPVLEVYVELDAEDTIIIKSRQIYAVKTGIWIDDFLSYFGAYCRLRAISEATREKYRSEMEAFWQVAGI